MDEVLMKQLADILLEGLAVAKGDKILFANDVFLRIFGWSADEIVGKSASDIYSILRSGLQDSEDEDIPEDMISIRGNTGFRSKILRSDAEYRYVEARISLFRSSGDDYLMIKLLDITTNKHAEKINNARLKLLEFSYSHNLHELLVATLNELEELTGSRIGFYHFVDTDQHSLSLQAWSSRTTAEFCTADPGEKHYALDQAGVWTDCLKIGGPLIHNDYESLSGKKGLPPGHAKVERELTVPIFRNKKALAILGVGNKPTDYTSEDVDAAHRLADLAFEIAERKLREEKIEITNERLNIAIRAANFGVWDWDVANNILTWDETMYVLYGLSRNDFTGAYEAWKSAVHPEDMEMAHSEVEKALKGVSNYDVEFRIMKPGGEVRYIHALAQVLRDRTGKPLRMLGMNFDITAKKLADLELLQKMRELEKFNDLTVGRELMMIELKREVNQCLKKSGHPPKYNIVDQPNVNP
jgi:PAS domain S-box-containing protein